MFFTVLQANVFYSFTDLFSQFYILQTENQSDFSLRLILCSPTPPKYTCSFLEEEVVEVRAAAAAAALAAFCMVNHSHTGGCERF